MTTIPPIYDDFRPPPLLPVTGLTTSQCRAMQGVVLHRFMEESREPLVAKEILEALGLAFHLAPDDAEDRKTSSPVELLWDRGTSVTSEPRKAGM